MVKGKIGGTKHFQISEFYCVPVDRDFGPVRYMTIAETKARTDPSPRAAVQPNHMAMPAEFTFELRRWGN